MNIVGSLCQNLNAIDTRFARNEQASVLVVEDSEDDFELMSRILRSKELHVIKATDGEQAIRIIDDSPPPLSHRISMVFLDLKLPVIDGLEVLRRIRLQSPTLPVVVVTGDDSPEVAARIADHGFTALITKPLDHIQLDRLLAMRGIS